MRYAWSRSVVNFVWFALVYGGCDFLSAHRHRRAPIHFAKELEIPLRPAMIVVYMSIYVLFLAAPFILRSRRELRALVATLAVVILCGGIGFLLFPLELGFAPPREAELGAWAELFHFADRLNLTYNLLPSLHVARGCLCHADLMGG